MEDCHEIISVAPFSPAAMIGLEEGDYILRVDGKNSATVGPTFDGLDRYPTKYEVISHKSARTFRFQTTGIDLGLEVKRPEPAMAKHWQVDQGYHELALLWDTGAWVRLENLTRPRWGDLINKYHMNYIGSPINRYPPVSLFYGATQFEAGDAEVGIRKIKAFLNNYLGSFRSEVTAVALFYLAIFAYEANDEEQGEHFLRTAWKLYPHARIAGAHRHLLKADPEPHESLLQGQTFPVDYTLPVIDEQCDPISLKQTLTEMPEGSVFLVAAMGSQRANGPYDDFLHNYIRWKHTFGEWIHGIHILTRTTVRDEFADRWVSAEAQARKEKLGIHVLHDDVGVNNALNISSTPAVFFIDRHGTILHQPYEPVGRDIWSALSYANAGSPEL